MPSAPAYYQSLFSRPESEAEPTKKGSSIPQGTLYDVPVQPQLAPKSRHMTVFGFSPQNREHVLSRIQELVQIDRKEEGKNYVSIWTDDPLELEKVMKLNYEVINGEMIGVLRRNCGVIDDEDVYAKKKGVFQIISEYLFGKWSVRKVSVYATLPLVLAYVDLSVHSCSTSHNLFC